MGGLWVGGSLGESGGTFALKTICPSFGGTFSEFCDILFVTLSQKFNLSQNPFAFDTLQFSTGQNGKVSGDYFICGTTQQLKLNSVCSKVRQGGKERQGGRDGQGGCGRHKLHYFGEGLASDPLNKGSNSLSHANFRM